MKVISSEKLGLLVCQVLGTLPKDLTNDLHNVKLECAKNIISSKLFECLGKEITVLHSKLSRVPSSIS